MSKINLYVDTHDTDSWVQTNSGIETCLALERLFRSMAIGGRVKTANLIAEAAPVAATGVVTWSAAVTGGDTVTINGTATTATQHNSRGTLTLVSAIATDIADVNGNEFVGVAGAVVLGELTFDTRTSDTLAAASLAAQINGYAALLGLATATSALGVVTVRSVAAGTGGNAITISSPDTTITASAATLTGGAAVANNQWDFGGSNSQTAAAFAACVLASSTALISAQVTAAAVLGVVTLTALAPGVTGNAISLAESGTGQAVSGVTNGRMTGGAAGTSSSFTF